MTEVYFSAVDMHTDIRPFPLDLAFHCLCINNYPSRGLREVV
jgi:hypothetical protein